MTEQAPLLETAANPLAQLTTAVEAIREKIERDEFHAGLVNRLQDELDLHRRGLADRLLLPIVTGILRLYSDVSKQIDAVRREPAEKVTPDRLATVVAEFRDDLELLLDHAGVGMYVEPGDTFNPHRQVAQRPEPTPDPELTGKIAARLRPGFEFNGRVVEKERVIVYVSPQPHSPVS